MMRGVRRLFYLLIVAGAAFAAQAGRMVTVEAATPIFRAPSFDAPLLGIANRAFQAEEKAEKLVLVSRHPLARYHRFSELLLPDGQTGYVNIHLTATERGHLPFRQRRRMVAVPPAAAVRRRSACGGGRRLEVPE